MATYTSSQTGLWSAQSTWGGSGPPANGDKAIISTTHIVTVDVDTTVGTSPTAGTDAITVNGTGKLIIASSKTLISRGDMGVHGNGYVPGVLMNSGSTLEFDASLAVSPASTFYSLYATNAFAFVLLECDGISGSHCTVRSNAGGGCCILCDGSAVTQSAGLIATYTDFLRIGDGTHAGFIPYFFTDSVTWDVQDCTFTSCGPVNAGGSPAGTSICRHKNNTHITSLNTYNWYVNYGVATVAGVNELSGNVFDLPIGYNGSTTGSPPGVRFIGNYLGGTTFYVSPVGSAGASNWSLFQYNLVIGGVTPSGTDSYGCAGDVLDNYLFIDSYTDLNVHFPDTSIANGALLSFLRNVMEASYFNINPADESDGIVTNNTTDQQTIVAKYNLIVPCGSGRGSTPLIGYRYSSMPFVTFQIEHNTCIPAVDCLELAGVEDASGNRSGTLKNNLFWDNVANRGPILFDVSHGNAASPTPQVDIFPPAAILNNGQYNILQSDPSKSFLTNQGNGYVEKFTSTPGGSDIYANPQFLDKSRNLPTFDTAYLHHVASVTWASQSAGHTFAVGDIVSDQNGTYYGNALINYRCILAHTKNTANSEPGIGSSWHTYWEFATLYSIRQAMTNKTTYFGNSPIITLLQWVRQGFAPRNILFHNTATDGTDVGAIPFYSPPPISLSPTNRLGRNYTFNRSVSF